MIKFLTIISAVIIVLCYSSCSQYKNVPYFQDLNNAKSAEEKIENYTQLKIQPGDILGINVTSLNPEAAAVFNTSLSRVSASADQSVVNNVAGFKVDLSGEVQLPLVGTMQVGGFTTDEVSKRLAADLSQYLKSPIVNMRILNFKISVMGDVLRPDVFTVQNDHINVNEALSLAGDLNITAKRQNVLLIREINGKRQYFTIDLTKKELFNSPYYYLKNNDILYVTPDKTKYATVERSSKPISLILSALSVAAIVISAILIQHR